MEETFDRQKMMEILVDPEISAILVHLEDGSKESSYLAERLQMTDSEIQEKLSYVIQHGFVIIDRNGDKLVFSVDKEKLNKIVENDGNFSGVVDGLTELDSFLN